MTVRKGKIGIKLV
jgi:hypothetical protein